ncbi:LysR family transcriptional regulator [Rugamonas rubra]|uniref:Transcriptional regulator, LysR family n=1 Tax=Rugamonas rubra TaxID=758825 RepID=A0A1I4THB0_9BURK|nr:LysR family transcriptional regulator [Rugamonas rubra]SFM75940.1 transcriptional regulator, LysR family [Rugamonas rubra]
MIASTQYKLSAADLDVVLALVRCGTLAEAGARLGLDGSTIFRGVQRMEKGLGQRLFERSRSGFRPAELAQRLAAHAEQIESQLEAARAAAQSGPGEVAGVVRLTTTDSLLHGLLAPALGALRARHPLLRYELHAGNELASLTRRDADIALRATRRPPPHLLGKHLGPVRMAVYTASAGGPAGPAGSASPAGSAGFDAELAHGASWIAPDDALPEHPSVLWRKKHFPKVVPSYSVSSLLTVAELVGRGLGIGVLPVFLAAGRAELAPLSEAIAECQTELWLLTHPEARYLTRVAAVYAALSQQLVLE